MENENQNVTENKTESEHLTPIILNAQDRQNAQPAFEDAANLNLNGDVAPEVKERTWAGVLGALLFASVGGVLWYLLYQIGFIAGLSGILAVTLAFKGYKLFAKGESMKGIIICIILSVAVIILAWYVCLASDMLYTWNNIWYPEGYVDYEINFWFAFCNAYEFLFDTIGMYYWGDLGIGIILCVLGCINPIRKVVNRVKQKR